MVINFYNSQVIIISIFFTSSLPFCVFIFTSTFYLSFICTYFSNGRISFCRVTQRRQLYTLIESVLWFDSSNFPLCLNYPLLLPVSYESKVKSIKTEMWIQHGDWIREGHPQTITTFLQLTILFSYLLKKKLIQFTDPQSPNYIIRTQTSTIRIRSQRYKWSSF